MTHALPFLDRLALPLIAAPMLRVSGIELVSAACVAGVIGAFPTANCQTLDEFDAWLTRLDEEAAAAPERKAPAPYCPNLIMRRDPVRVMAEVELIARHRAQLVITSVGSPASVVPRLHEAGCRVFADVASLHHAVRAIESGVDGLVLLTAGAGGHTGWANPFAFVRAVRRVFGGPIVLAGGLSDGVALRAARELGCDLGIMGTRFIATQESLASDDYRHMLVDSSIDDVLLTRGFTGLPASFLAPSARRLGIDISTLDESISVEEARRRYGGGANAAPNQRWTDIWSAGHSVSGVRAVPTVAELVDALVEEYRGTAAA
ncbi:NAD(P)H-dependent flavin oxidoreductase [Variovorax atrisoli]|uniref:NAD(P)H-dependent flavin oxidoreductase n=1 Tax=Variovorax atrisoli TaxID=3394203 RepID=UPI000372C06D|nr:nitronate monooxygenase [Variovorax paradoxus]